MGLTAPKVGIVGGTGRMGSWLARLLEGRGIRVFRTGRKTELTPAEMARQCDVVVISVPIADTVRIIREIGPLVSENGLLMDLTSVKKGPVEAMMKYSRAEVVGIHPLFGPLIKSNKGFRIALCRGRGEDGLKWIKDIFQDEGFTVFLIEPEKHDHMMGIIQGTHHFSTIALALSISRCGYEAGELLNVSTPTFLQSVERIRAILDQPEDLFRSLMMDNPVGGDFVEQYLESVEQLIHIIRQEDREAFRDLFASLSRFFNNDSSSPGFGGRQREGP